MKSITIAVLLMSTALQGFAQNQRRIEIETDPIAFALNGYSFHFIHVSKRFRTDLGIFGIHQPDGYSPNKGYDIQSAGAGLKLNYLMNKTETVFAGIGFGYYENNIQHIESGTSAVHKVASVGFHAGYRWFMFRKSANSFRNLYLTPWASMDYNRPLNNILFEKNGYKQSAFSIFPTVHIGYKF